MIRKLLENPVVLRDLGWAYYPPILGRFSRKWAQLLGAVLILALILGLAGSVEAKVGNKAGAIIFLIFAGGGYLAFLFRAPITGLRAWSRERELHVLEELILTGMKPSEFAAAKVFARGFPFMAGSIVIMLMGLGGVGWLTFDANLNSVEWNLVLISLGDILFLPAILITIYLRMLRIGVRSGFQLHRAFISYAFWILAGFCCVIVFPGVLMLLGELLRMGESKFLGLAVPFSWLCVPGFWALVLLSYLYLLCDIEEHYIQNVDV